MIPDPLRPKGEYPHPGGPSPRQWPCRTSLQDYGAASTPAQIHAVALGLERQPTPAPWWLEAQGLEARPQASWRSWYPGCSAPDWWTVRAEDGSPRCLVRWHLRHQDERMGPGFLWLRAFANRQPLLYAPHGPDGAGYLVTPDWPGWAGGHDPGAVGAQLDRSGWPGGFTTVAVQDPVVISQAFGGYFMPGALRLDWLMALALSRGVSVPGFPKTARLRPGTGP